MNILNCALLSSLLVLALSPGGARAQTMQAVTTPPGPGLRVVLTWPSDSPTHRANLYRKVTGAPAFPATPLNAAPLQRPVNCAEIKAVIPSGSAEWKQLSEGLVPGTPFDPCDITTLTAGSPAEGRLQFLARTSWKIAAAIGQGYIDQAVSAGTSYEYELRSVNAFGAETGVLFTGVNVKAGTPKVIPAPPALSATAADGRVLLLWGNVDDVAGFAVYRATAPAGPFERVNPATFLTQVNEELDGKPLPAPSNGFLDIQRWANDGSPATHPVEGVPIAGPGNGITYHYKVAAIDLLGQAGPLSAAVSAKPLDQTPPAAATGITVTAFDVQNRLEVRWSSTSLDANGHLEQAPIAAYRLFRYEGENAPPAAGVQIGADLPAPPPGQLFVTASDNAPLLRPPFGEKTYWYRVEAADAAGNVSARSAAIGGHLKDITAPSPPKGIKADGFDDFIAVQWQPNTEPDLDGYWIYRTLCHNGVANPCPPVEPREPEQTKERPKEPGHSHGIADQPVGKDSGTIPCTGQYVLIGHVSKADAAAMGGTLRFEDHTVPPGSPLCYSYWVKAYDRAQNRSGAWPFPDPATEQTVCQRLRDKTPPEAAIISGLFARDSGIQVDWVGPPVQDIRAYHVYRSDAENGVYQWVGGMTVEPPPGVPQILAAPYAPPAAVCCGTIPLIAIDSMSLGTFLDSKVDPKKIYWYKVLGIDQNGNEAPLSTAAPISTFTFTRRRPASPVISSVSGTSSAPFALVVHWTPAFDAARHRGFAVFRSETPGGLFRQVGNLLSGSEYQDLQVVKGASYWYKVLIVDQTGQLSDPSAPVSGALPP